MQESRRKLLTILEAPYEKRRWQNDNGERGELDTRLDMKLIWSLLKIVAQHAQEVKEAGVLSAEDEIFIKVGCIPFIELVGLRCCFMISGHCKEPDCLQRRYNWHQ